MKCLDVVKEDMQEEVGEREDEVSDQGYGESAMATHDGKERGKMKCLTRIWRICYGDL